MAAGSTPSLPAIAPRRPPPLPAARAPAAGPAVLATAAGAALAVVVARGISASWIPWPECGLLRFAGVPCPGCGGTRSLAALGGGDVLAALAWNPLVAAAALLALAAGALVLLDRVGTGGRATAAVAGRVARLRGLGWALAALVALNWLHLILNLP